MTLTDVQKVNLFPWKFLKSAFLNTLQLKAQMLTMSTQFNNVRGNLIISFLCLP